VFVFGLASRARRVALPGVESTAFGRPMLMNHTTNDAINSKRCRLHALPDSVPKGLPVLGRSLVLAITVSLL
jgi:hypothetical protein